MKGSWTRRKYFLQPLANGARTPHISGIEFYLGQSAASPWGPLLVSPTDNLMPRTHSCVATPSMERFHAYRYRKVLQFHQGVRLHSTRRQIQGRVRARLGGRARRTRQLERAPEDLVRARARAKRQDVRGRSESRLICGYARMKILSRKEY